MTAERQRLEEARDHKALWKRWGPSLSERQWGTLPSPLPGQSSQTVHLSGESGPGLLFTDIQSNMGQGLDAGHQTGWTGQVAFLIGFFERVRPEDMLHRIRVTAGLQGERAAATVKGGHA